MRRFKVIILAATTIFLSLALPARAEDAALTPGQQAWKDAEAIATKGPADIPLGDQAVLHLPAGDMFIPKDASNKLMEAWGNGNSPNLLGIAAPIDNEQMWITTIDFINEGYVKDDDAKNWNAADLLASLKEGTEAQNEDRKKMGMAALDVVDWIEAPAYDAAKHQLVWSLKAVERGAPADADTTVNYNTYALGRDGYLELNLLTSGSTVNHDKPFAKELLAALAYNQGKRYEDFKESTDRVAEYGIAALIGGVVAKKLGLLAIAGVFIAKFFKLILVGVAVAGGAVTRLFRRRSDDTA